MRTYWVARARTLSGDYVQRRLGQTDDQRRADGDQFLSFEQASRLAQEWFNDKDLSPSLGNALPIGIKEELSFSPVGSIYTIGHALSDFLEWKRLIAARSYVQTLVSMTNYHLMPRLARLSAEEFNGEHLRVFVQDVLETPAKLGNSSCKPRRAIGTFDEEALRKRKITVNTLIGVLRSALRMAWENGKIENGRGWQTLRRIPNVTRARVLHLSRPECRKLLLHCRPDLARLVLGALYTGCRITELLRMRASDVGRDGYGVYVTPVKRYRPRFVFLPDEGMAFFLLLAKSKAPDDFLFVRDSGKNWYSNQRSAFKKAVLDARLPSAFSFHGLRHTYASQLVQAGAPLSVIADQLGHANVMAVIQTYAHLSPQIRESEVRQRFTSVSRQNALIAAKQRSVMKRWRNSLHGGDWRTYAAITDTRSRSKTR
jgi:integrase